MLQCGRCLGYLHPHNPRGRNLADPEFVRVFSFVFSTRGIYSTEGKNNDGMSIETNTHLKNFCQILETTITRLTCR